MAQAERRTALCDLSFLRHGACRGVGFRRIRSELRALWSDFVSESSGFSGACVGIFLDRAAADDSSAYLALYHHGCGKFEDNAYLAWSGSCVDISGFGIGGLGRGGFYDFNTLGFGRRIDLCLRAVVIRAYRSGCDVCGSLDQYYGAMEYD